MRTRQTCQQSDTGEGLSLLPLFSKLETMTLEVKPVRKNVVHVNVRHQFDLLQYMCSMYMYIYSPCDSFVTPSRRFCRKRKTVEAGSELYARNGLAWVLDRSGPWASSLRYLHRFFLEHHDWAKTQC